MELLHLQPVFKEVVWGGKKLQEKFGYKIPSDRTGECWAISAHENGDCRIKGGEYDGQLLSRLWKEHTELFGNYPSEKYPLLVKIIDADKDLSIQVHPDDDYARIHENGSMGKMECWYVLDCKDGAEIVIGHHAKNHREMEKMIREYCWDDLIRTEPIRPGSFLQIEPGCLHAIKEGTLILETQQSSDITYRVYDYDRKENGKLRPLHVEKSIDTIAAPYRKADCDTYMEEVQGGKHIHFITCSHYSVGRYEIKGVYEKEFSRFFTNVSVISGSGHINGEKVEKGGHVIIPASSRFCVMEGEMDIICSSPL